MSFEFATASRIIVGPGRAAELSPRWPGLGSRALVCTGSRPGSHAGLLAGLQLPATVVTVAGEPTTESARAAAATAREQGADVIAAIGGGSVIDLAKAVAMLLGNGGDPLDYLEVIGSGRKITKPAVPLVAVPTTAGTGAEVTANAVLCLAGPPGQGQLAQSPDDPAGRDRRPAAHRQLPAAGHRGQRARRADPVPGAVRLGPGERADRLPGRGRAAPRRGRAAAGLHRRHRRPGAHRHGPVQPAGRDGPGQREARRGPRARRRRRRQPPTYRTAPPAPRCSRQSSRRTSAPCDPPSPASPALSRYAEAARLLTGDPGAAIEDGIAWIRADRHPAAAFPGCANSACDRRTSATSPPAR